MRIDTPGYHHRQVSVLTQLFGALALMVILAWYSSNGDGIALLVAGSVALLVGVLHALTIRVTDTTLAWHFGFRLFSKSAPLADIAGVEPVRNRWWYGWGIRYTAHGWLYNVAGLDAVEITRRNGKTFRLGTDQPDILASAIRARLEA